MVPPHRRGRWLRLAAAGIIQAAVAIARGGLVVHPPKPPTNLEPWLLPLYDQTILSACLFTGVLVGTYAVMALLQLIADGRFPRKAGPVEFDTQSAVLAQRGHESLELIDELLAVVKDGRRREAEAQALIADLKHELQLARTSNSRAHIPDASPVRPASQRSLIADHPPRTN